MAGSRTSLVFLRIIYSTWNPIPIHFSSYRTASLFTPSYPHQHLLFPLPLPCSPPSPSSYSYSFLFLLFLEVLDKEPGPLLMLGKLSAAELSLWPLPFLRWGHAGLLSLTPNSLLTRALLLLSAEITGLHTIPNHTSLLAGSGTSQVYLCLWAFAPA